MNLEYFLKKYDTSIHGLDPVQVSINKKNFGTNIVTTKKRDSFFYILLVQLGGFFSVVLSVAAILLFLLGEIMDFYVVLFVVILNTFIETIQRYRSDTLFESLTKTLPQQSVVIRKGKKSKIESSEIVVGDIVVLQSGDKVPADALVVFAENFKVDESILTGESKLVSKTLVENYTTESIIDNEGMVFAGTHVGTGVAHVLVIQVGNTTQLGMITQKVSTVDTQLPLYKEIRRLSFVIFMFVLVLTSFVFIIGLVQNQPLVEIFKITVALLVSAIPESLPVMLTLILAYGFKRMSDKKVLVRKMQSLDVLGKITVLALDKTGTITHNQMKVEKVCTFNQKELYVTGDGYEPKGSFIYNKEPVQISNFEDVDTLMRHASLSSNGSYYFDSDKEDWVLETGDPTEVSLLVLGEKSKNNKTDLQKEYLLKESVSFTNQNKYHSAKYEYQGKNITIYTGAPEVVYRLSSHVLEDGIYKKINEDTTEFFNKKIKEYSSQGYRTIVSAVETDDKVVCLGMFAIQDSIRADILESVEEVHQKGIDIIIITGDHKDVAVRVAQKIGISVDESSILTGDDMDNLTDIQIKNILLGKKVFARVTPQQKLKILDLLKELGKVVGMTGDGVNDTLALARADIGIAMGTISSDSAKEAADIVLLDNKFGSIVYGVEEGKNIFLNIRKTILFLLSTNFAEMFVVVFAVILVLPLPISAAGILWLNLVTDTFLVIGFALERSCKKCTQNNKIFAWPELHKTIYLGMVMTLVALAVFMSTYSKGLLYAQSMTLLTLIIMQWFNILNIRSGEYSVFKYGFALNKGFIFGWAISALLTLAAFNLQFMREVLGIHPLNSIEWVYCAILASSILWCEEIRKIAQKTKLFVCK